MTKPTTTMTTTADSSRVKLWGNLDISALPSTCIELLSELWVKGWNPSYSDPFVYRPDSGELAYTCRRLLRRHLGTAEIREQAKRIGDLAELLYLEDGRYDYEGLPESLRKHHQLGE